MRLIFILIVIIIDRCCFLSYICRNNMASHLPPVIPRPEKATQPSFKEGHFGVPDTMLYGLASVHSEALGSHPLETMERKFAENRMQMDYAMMKRIQGTHAPMRMMMEKQAASKIQRLPFLPSSNLMLDTLTGADDTIGFEDIFNVPSESEAMINPLLAMERHVGFI